MLESATTTSVECEVAIINVCEYLYLDLYTVYIYLHMIRMHIHPCIIR